MTVESLKPLAETDLLEQVKIALKMEGNNYNDNTIRIWIKDVKDDLLFAGVSADVVGSTLAVGCITHGVEDKWANPRPDHSDLYYQGVERLRSIKVKEV